MIEFDVFQLQKLFKQCFLTSICLKPMFSIRTIECTTTKKAEYGSAGTQTFFMTIFWGFHIVCTCFIVCTCYSAYALCKITKKWSQSKFGSLLIHILLFVCCAFYCSDRKHGFQAVGSQQTLFEDFLKLANTKFNHWIRDLKTF